MHPQQFERDSRLCSLWRNQSHTSPIPENRCKRCERVGRRWHFAKKKNEAMIDPSWRIKINFRCTEENFRCLCTVHGSSSCKCLLELVLLVCFSSTQSKNYSGYIPGGPLRFAGDENERRSRSLGLTSPSDALCSTVPPKDCRPADKLNRFAPPPPPPPPLPPPSKGVRDKRPSGMLSRRPSALSMFPIEPRLPRLPREFRRWPSSPMYGTNPGA